MRLPMAAEWACGLPPPLRRPRLPCWPPLVEVRRRNAARGHGRRGEAEAWRPSHPASATPFSSPKAFSMFALLRCPRLCALHV
uniref:Uncharacterized protein n=1 Tax=Arundo donax TaxID=35708 RepID=A0A0A9A5H7_ARUDO